MKFRIDADWKKAFSDIMYAVILILSALLIVFISIDTFKHIPFLENHTYMTFQFWVCIVFILDFFIGLALADDRWHYTRRRFLFLLLSIPYLNIVNYFGVHLSSDELYWVRFIPLARGALAMSIVVGYLSTNRVSSLFGSYITILVAAIYFGSLIFFAREHSVNTLVPDYWAALWWACMDATTIGCPIQPVTVTGKIIGCVLSCMGVMIFPLFTVYITTLVQRYNARRYPMLSDIFGVTSSTRSPTHNDATGNN